MVYADFSLEDLKLQFGIEDKVTHLFYNVKAEEISPSLQSAIAEAQDLPVRSEKAQSEFVVAPILLDLRKRNQKFFTIYSGDFLVADTSAGLTGECDFILAKNTGSFTINLPIFTLVEAKKNDIELGIPQCAAQMVGALRYNSLHQQPIQVIYGCVTTGNEWKFMRLENQRLEIDQKTYFLNDLGTIIGILQSIIDYYKAFLQV